VRLVRAANGRLVLAHARDPHEGSGRGGYDLDAVAEPVRHAGIPVETCIVNLVPGEESETIRQTTREHGVDVIVMSTHGRASLQRRFRGSILERILHQAEVPVLLVPASHEPAWPDDRPLRIVVRLDSSACARQVLGPAAGLAQAADATLLLLRIVQVPHVTMNDVGYVYPRFDWEAALADAPHILGIVDRLRTGGRTVELRLLVAAPSFDLADFAIGEEVSIIAIATAGYDDIDELMFGQVPTRILKRGGMPVLITSDQTMT